MDYPRVLSDSFIKHLQHDLNFLLQAVGQPFQETGVAVDAQLRNGNAISLYLGLNQLIGVSFDDHAQSLQTKANPFFRLRELGVKENYTVDEFAQFRGHLKDYLDAVVTPSEATSAEG